MGIINKTVVIKWNNSNKTYYINKGYKFTKIYDNFRVKTEDIMSGSAIKVNIKCDNCGKTIKDVSYNIYYNYFKANNKYFCDKCRMMFSKEKEIKTKFKNGNATSLKQWCVDNNNQDIPNRWDYELNNCKPDEIAYATHKKYYLKCPLGIHKSELQNIHGFTTGWQKSLDCKACNSFAQWGIDNLGEDFLEKYWDYEKNTLDPWKITNINARKIYIKCQEKDYHGSYETVCSAFLGGGRCPYCINHKIHILDSLGTIYPNTLNIWGNKNKKSAFDYAPMSNKEIWWKCEKELHKEYKRGIAASNVLKFRCPKCQNPSGEIEVDRILTKYNWIGVKQKTYNNLNSIEKENKCYIHHKTFEGLIGLGGGSLSYDFYLPIKQTLIEFQGQQHEKYCKAFHKSKKDFEKQQEHDKRKKEYALNNNIKLLEIWYWDFDRIEEILVKELNL